MPMLDENRTPGEAGHLGDTNQIAKKLNVWVDVVADYGADPTGVADSTAAFVAAVATGKNVHVPSGTFAVNCGQVVWPSPNTTTFQPSPSMRGDGPTRTIIRANGTGTLLDVSAPTISGTGAYTAGTNHGIVIEGINFEGRPAQTAIFINRFFQARIVDCDFNRVAGELYGFDYGVRDERIFDLGPPRRDDSNINLHLVRCMFLRINIAVDTSTSSAGAHQRFDNCYIQGVTQSEMDTIQATYPTFANHGLKLCSNHITGIGTQIVSCVRGLWLARGGDVASIDRMSTAVGLVSWHFEGMKAADIYIDACRGLDLYACEFIDHNGADVTWVPVTIYIADGGTNDVGPVRMIGGFLAPSYDVTYGPNWRGVYCGSNFTNNGNYYVEIDSPVITAMQPGAAVNSTAAANFSLVIQKEGPKVVTSAVSVRALSARIVGDSTARTSVRPNGVAMGPGGVTAEDTLLFRSAEGTMGVINTAATLSGNIQSSPSTTTANFASLTAVINTIGKFAGKMAWNSNTLKPVWAVGAAAGSVWVNADGTTAHTPI